MGAGEGHGRGRRIDQAQADPDQRDINERLRCGVGLRQQRQTDDLDHDDATSHHESTDPVDERAANGAGNQERDGEHRETHLLPPDPIVAEIQDQ